jgi:glycosyltransferase involved in cell wall biosynthesis
MENPLVSVLCITYNHENYIRQALDSFLMQETDFPYEIIVHDDASTDGTPEIIREYLRRYPAKLKVILQTENQMSKGSSVIDEFLIPAAAGKYAALCEGDDYWTDPHKLQKQADYMKANPQCSLCVHASDYVHPDGSFMREEKRYPESCLVPTGEVILGGGGFCHTGSIMTYLQLYRTLPDYCHMLPIGDYPLQIYLASSGETYYFADKMSAYRFNAAGSWTSRVRMNFKVLAELEQDAKIHLTLVYRGTQDVANAFITAQDELIEKLYPAQEEKIDESEVTDPAAENSLESEAASN